MTAEELEVGDLFRCPDGIRTRVVAVRHEERRAYFVAPLFGGWTTFVEIDALLRAGARVERRGVPVTGSAGAARTG